MIKELSIIMGKRSANTNNLKPKRMITVNKLQDNIRMESVELVYLTIPEYSRKTMNEIIVAPKHNRKADAKSFGLNCKFLVS